MIIQSPPLLCVCVCWDSWIRKWRVWCMSDRIQNAIHQIGSKIYIRLDPRNASDWIRNPFRHQSVSGSEPCAGISLRDITFMSCRGGSCKCQSMSWNVTSVTTCHDVMTCHVSRDVFLDEGLCCHSSWYLPSLTLVIGFVTAASRLCINMNRYHSVHDHIERWESSYYLIQSPDFVLSVHSYYYIVWRFPYHETMHIRRPLVFCLSRSILFLIWPLATRWLLSSKQFYVRQSLNLWTNAFSPLLVDFQRHFEWRAKQIGRKCLVGKTDLKSGSEIRFEKKMCSLQQEKLAPLWQWLATFQKESS